MNQGGQDASTRSSDGVAQGNGTSMHVQAVQRHPQQAIEQNVVEGESFVVFKKMEVGNAKLVLFQQLLNRRNWSLGKAPGLTSSPTTAQNPGNGLQTMLLHSLEAGQYQGRRPIRDLRGIARGQHPVFFESRAQGSQRFQGGVGPHALVFFDFFHPFAGLDLEGCNLTAEVASFLGFSGPQVGVHRHFVQFRPGHPELGSQSLGLVAHGLAREGVGKPVTLQNVLQLLRRTRQVLVAPTGPAGEVKPALGHGFHTTYQHHFGIAILNGQRTIGCGLHPRGTHHIHCVAIYGVGDTGLEGCLAGRQLPMTCPQNLPKNK